MFRINGEIFFHLLLNLIKIFYQLLINIYSSLNMNSSLNYIKKSVLIRLNSKFNKYFISTMDNKNF